MEKEFQQQPSNCLRVVLYGPESTGKTTIAKALAQYYNTQWVPEFARDYLQKKWDLHQETCTKEDLLVIAKGQLQAENQAIRTAQNFLFCDTNILVTRVWSETHFNGYCNPILKSWSEQWHYDYYFLTDIDVPWQADDLRDRPHDRKEMHTYFEGILREKKHPYTYLTGNIKTRMNTAISVLNALNHDKTC